MHVYTASLYVLIQSKTILSVENMNLSEIKIGDIQSQDLTLSRCKLNIV